MRAAQSRRRRVVKVRTVKTMIQIVSAFPRSLIMMVDFDVVYRCVDGGK